MDLELVEKESKVGGYSADILAKAENSESDTESYVVIENQLEDSNHDHLGKLITYASGKKAKAIVWVVKTAREEHREAIKQTKTSSAAGSTSSETKNNATNPATQTSSIGQLRK